jgi:peptidoglycan-associated lipoprotein
MIMKRFLIICLLILAVGCTKTYTRPAEEEAKPEEVVKEEVIEVKEQETEEIAYAKEEDIGEQELSPEEVAEMAKTVLKDVLFDFDKYQIRPDARPSLDEVASLLGDKKDLSLIIEGHCDERGTTEYNLALGERRAKSAKNYIVSLGVSPSRMNTVTYGEEKPVCTYQEENCWQKNRRAHFVVVK